MRRLLALLAALGLPALALADGVRPGAFDGTLPAGKCYKLKNSDGTPAGQLCPPNNGTRGIDITGNGGATTVRVGAYGDIDVRGNGTPYTYTGGSRPGLVINSDSTGVFKGNLRFATGNSTNFGFRIDGSTAMGWYADVGEGTERELFQLKSTGGLLMRGSTGTPYTMATELKPRFTLNNGSGGGTNPAIKFVSGPNANISEQIGVSALVWYSNLDEVGETPILQLGAGGELASNAGSGLTAFGANVNGARFDFGAGVNDYADSNGTTITFHAPIASSGGITSNSGDIIASGGGFISGSGVFTNNNGLATVVKGQVADGATAIAVKFTSANTLSTAGAEIAAFYSDNGSTKRAYIDKDGGALFSSDIQTNGSVYTGSGLISQAGGPVPIKLLGNATNGATAVATIFDNNASLSTAGAKLSSFRNAGTEKANVDKDGMVQIGVGNTTATPTCDSTQRFKFWVVGGGGGVKDTVQVCAKDAADAYAWRTIY